MKKNFLALISLAILFELTGCSSSTNIGTPQPADINSEGSTIISGAFSGYQLSNELNADTSPRDLLPYINHTKLDTTTKLQTINSPTLQDCSERLPCLFLESGGIIQFDSDQNFGGTSPTHAIRFNIDPDGTGTKYKHFSLYQFFNGQLATSTEINSNKIPVVTKTSPLIAEI